MCVCACVRWDADRERDGRTNVCVLFSLGHPPGPSGPLSLLRHRTHLRFSQARKSYLCQGGLHDITVNVHMTNLGSEFSADEEGMRWMALAFVVFESMVFAASVVNAFMLQAANKLHHTYVATARS